MSRLTCITRAIALADRASPLKFRVRWATLKDSHNTAHLRDHEELVWFHDEPDLKKRALQILIGLAVPIAIFSDSLPVRLTTASFTGVSVCVNCRHVLGQSCACAIVADLR